MKTRLLATPLLMVTCFQSPVAAKKCLEYGPTVVTLSGTIRSHVFPGPPNYESIKKGDQRETAIILTLVAKTCTAGNDRESLDVPETGVRGVQLVVTTDAHWKIIRRLIGKRARVTGNLFHAHTGHHRTKVLIEVSQIRAAG